MLLGAQTRTAHGQREPHSQAGVANHGRALEGFGLRIADTCGLRIADTCGLRIVFDEQLSAPPDTACGQPQHGGPATTSAAESNQRVARPATRSSGGARPCASACAVEPFGGGRTGNGKNCRRSTRGSRIRNNICRNMSQISTYGKKARSSICRNMSRSRSSTSCRIKRSISANRFTR